MYYALAIGSSLAVAVLVWRFFVVPLGREMHERELEVVRRKLERLQARRSQEPDTADDGN